MDDIPNTLEADGGAFGLSFSTRSADANLRGLLQAFSRMLDQSVLLVSAQGTVLMAAQGGAFDGVHAVIGERWTRLWPRESWPLAQGALQTAAQDNRAVTIAVSRMPDGRSAQMWEASITPMATEALPPEGSRDVPHLLVCLRDVTAETQVADMKQRATGRS